MKGLSTTPRIETLWEYLKRLHDTEPDQPFLTDMTRHAIHALAGPDGDRPFALLVEGASIDKQSHRNHSADTIWDAIELDQAIGIARMWVGGRARADTLLLAIADHNQTMSILGVAEVSDEVLSNREPLYELSIESPVGQQSAQVYGDVVTNVRGPYNWSAREDPNSSDVYGPPRGKDQANAMVGGFLTIRTQMVMGFLRIARQAGKDVDACCRVQERRTGRRTPSVCKAVHRS